MSFAAGLSPDLLRAAACVFLFGWWVASRDLPVRYALLITGIKLLIPVAYFAYNDSGAFHLRDDLGYYYAAFSLMQRGYNAVTVFLHPDGLAQLMYATRSTHVAYYLWNLASMSAFGPHYFSPVFANVGTTFAAGYFFIRILRHLGCSGLYARAALAFFLLHWDILAWSSFLNLKDPLALALTLALFHHVLLVFKEAALHRFLWIILLVGLLFYLRFYVPFVMACAVLLHLFTQKKNMAALAFLAGFAAVIVAKGSSILSALRRMQPLDMLAGIPRFVLTPMPWKLSEGYEFLLIPSLLYLLMLLPSWLAVPALWKRSRHAPLLFLYLALIILAFSAVPDLQGPRQRFQVSFIFAWMQFHALWAFARYATRSMAPSPDAQKASLSQS